MGLTPFNVRLFGGPMYSFGCSACLTAIIKSSGKHLLNFFVASSFLISTKYFYLKKDLKLNFINGLLKDSKSFPVHIVS